MPELPTAQPLPSDLAAGDAPWFYFDGASAPEGEPRMSYLGAASEMLVAEPGHEAEFLQKLRLSLRERTHDLLPSDQKKPVGSTDQQRFTSGWVIALSYEFGLGLLGYTGLANTPRTGPYAYALRIDRVHVVTEAAEEPTTVSSQARKPVWRSSAAGYEAKVRECQAAIHRGDASVLCLTDTAETEVTGPYSPLALFERLRSIGRAIRGGIIVMDDCAIVSMSPERFLSVQGDVVTTHPIKGTRRRGETPALDVILATELGSDPKERAENLMIVDLVRNDLNRVCKEGTVRATRLLDVETHPSVHQLVSTIEGKLAQDHDVFDAITACFPAGSMIGAPKARAAQILAKLETRPRGLYSGCFGWIADSGDAELAMTIRGAELRGAVTPGSTGEVELLVGAGGGITAESVPKQEREERDLKAAPLLAAL